ncbi:MAG: hypothetical protein LUD27_02300 [Clostridia bacterium]|nr:hypothetical protein [Clostridia bacterium]
MSEERDIHSYESNSHKSKTSSDNVREKKTEKVINGEAKVRKKGFFGKLKSYIISSDDTRSVGSYIITDIMIPSIKKAISDVVTTGIDMLLYGEARHTNKSSGSRISYQNYYTRDSGVRERATRVSNGYEVKEIVVPSKGEAEMVLGTLEDLIDTYEIATVADYYDIVGIDDKYTDSYYGWTSIAEAKARPTSDGWVIIMPRPTQIK